MAIFGHSLEAWGQPGFDQVLKQELAAHRHELPLQAALAAGSYALEQPLDVMVIGKRETGDAIECKTGIFYQSLTPGCACAGDPTTETEQPEYAVVLVRIDKRTAETSFTLLNE